MTANTTQGFVYFLTDGEAIKIGFAKNPAKRLADLQIAQSFELVMIATFSAPKYQERIVHNMFKHLHIRGEWFRIDSAITDYIDDLEEQGFVVPVSEHAVNAYLEKRNEN